MLNYEKKIIIADSHQLMRIGTRHLLSAQRDCQIVGEVSCGLNIYGACSSLRPDIVLMELSLPGMDGVDVIQQLKKRWPEVTIIVLTADERHYRAHAAVAAGAQGIVFKSSHERILLDAFRAVGKSTTVFFDPAISHAQVSDAGPVILTRLTTRERQILKLIAEERRNRDIAEVLKISVKTVETHRLNLMRKLDAHCAVGLVKWALRLGLH